MDRHAQGILLISLSALTYSSTWLFTRLINLDAWTMLFWLGLFAGLMNPCSVSCRGAGGDCKMHYGWRFVSATRELFNSSNVEW